MTRDELLARYRHLRAINLRQQNEALKFVARGRIVEHGRRLDLAVGNTLVADSEDELALAFDLAVHTSRGGRSRAIDRYAHSVRPQPGSDEAMMLKAAQQARFGVWHVQERHAVLGLTIWDPLAESTLWLLDEGLESSAPVGSVFAGRLLAVDNFVMTCGAIVPVVPDMLFELHENSPRLSGRSNVEKAQDPRFAEMVFRAAIRTGVAETVAYVAPQDDFLDASQAA